MTLGQRIHELRTAAGLSQEQLAERLNVSRQAISKWELDTSAPDLDRLVLLGDLFGVSLDQLVRGTPPGGAAPCEPDIRQLAAENRRHRRTTVLAVVGSLAVLLGCVAFGFLCALRSAVLSIQYMLYRYMAAGEYAYAPDSFRLPLLLAAAVFGAGCAALLALLWKRRRA